MSTFFMSLAALTQMSVAVQIRNHVRTPNSTLIAVPLVITPDSEECPALNELPGLVPRTGRLLGTIKAYGTIEERTAMFESHGLTAPDTHVFRFYKDLDKVDIWMTDLYFTKRRELLDEGKIIWLDVMPKDWKLCVSGGCDDYFSTIAQVLSSIKPAQAFLSMGHEVDHDWPDMTGGSKDYILMVHRARDIISKSGGDNAVWKFVVSNQVLDAANSKSFQNVLERWPGDDYVDWVGFNIYLKYGKDNKDGTGTYVYGETYYTSNRSHSLQDRLDALTTKFKEASLPGRNFSAKTWELSTIGVHRNIFNETFSDRLGNENLGVPDEFRLEFLNELTYIVNEGLFPEFRSMAYFDFEDCKIDDNLVLPFWKWSTAKAFAENHQCWT